MSTRDELAEALDNARWPEGLWSNGYTEPPEASNEEIADALIAEGWRKMPATEELESALAVGLYKHILSDGIGSQELHRLQVREILALIERGSA